MKSTVLWSLIVFNAGMIALLVGRLWHEPKAMAQAAAAPMINTPGDYLAIPADFTGAITGVVVVLDQNSEQLSALTYDDGNRKFDAMLKIDLKPLFAAGLANNPRTR